MNIEQIITVLPKYCFNCILMENKWNQFPTYLDLINYMLTFSNHPSDEQLHTLSTPEFVAFLSPSIPIYSSLDLCGFGTIYNARGDVYRGELHAGLPHGNGTILYHNGCFWRGRWTNGERSGPGEYHYCKDVWQEGVWRHNKRVQWTSLRLKSSIYSNAKRLFDSEKGWFPFVFDREKNLRGNVETR